MSVAQCRAFEQAVQELSEVERCCLIGRAQGFKLREIGNVLRLDYRTVAEIIVGAVDKLQDRVARA